MENDGKTRIYIGTPGRGAWEVHPKSTPHDSRLKGSSAEAVHKRADFVAVNTETFRTLSDGSRELIDASWFVKDCASDDYFSVNKFECTGDGSYKKLAKTLEERTSKKGLTITVS